MKHGWEYKKLGDVSEIVGGSTPKTNIPSYWDGEYSWITPAELNGSKYIGSTERHITNEALAHTNLQLLPVGTVLLTSRAPIGKVAITKIPMYCNQGFKNIVPGDSLFNEFAYWYLTYKKDYIISLGRGATFKEISKSITEQIPIPVPPFEEQKAICSLLDKMNRVIEAKKEQLKELDNLAQAIFYDMFGDPVTNEKGWETKQLGDTGEIVSGSTPSTTDATNWDGNINWVTPAELNDQLFYGSTQRKLTEKGASGLTLMPTGTVLLSSRAPIGKLAITTEPMCCNQGFKNIVCGNKLNNIFLYYYLRLTMDNVKALGVGATFKEVSKKAISAYPIILPSLPLQQAFAEKVEAIERQKELINQSLREVQTLFDSRMDYWFSEEDDDLGQLDKLD